MGYIRLLVGEHDPESLPLLDDEKYQVKVPTITFSDKLHLYVGDHEVELFYLPGHTDGADWHLHPAGKGFLLR